MDFFFFLRGSETGKARGFFQQGISDKISYNNGCKYLVDKTLFYIWVKTNFSFLTLELQFNLRTMKLKIF